MKLSAVVLATTAHAQGHAQDSDWAWKGGWDVDLGDLKPTHEGEYVYNPKCKKRFQPTAQACVTAVLDAFKDSQDESILDNILNCPCMERCFNGAPCRTKGQFAEFSKRNTHQDYHSPLDASPVLADGVTLSEPVTLFWSDEFEDKDALHVDTEQWKRHHEGTIHNSNAGVADGKLKLKLRRRQNPTTYDGAKITSLWNQVASSEFTQEMIKYGYFEAKIQVPSDRRGRACKMKLVPSSDSSVLGDRIDIMSNAVGANNQYKTNVAYLDGNTEEKNPETHTLEEGRLHDEPHVFGLLWTKNRLEWYLDGKKIRTETGKSPQKPLFWQLEAEIIEDLNQGVDSATNWPAYCEFEYVRHFAIDDVNEGCMPKDKIEQEKCEKMYQDQNLSPSETDRLIMENCPCHIHCYNGCSNCGTYECSDSSLIDPSTEAFIKPQMKGGQPGFFDLEYSDEFNGDHLNTNKWVAIEKGQSNRQDLEGNEFHWRRSQNGLSGDGYLVQTVDKVPDVDDNGNTIDRYISGRISTAGLVSPIYGFYEARLDTLPVEGMQSAWWLWAENGTWNYDWNSKKPEWYTAQCDRRHTPEWRDSCTRENDEHHNPFGLTFPHMVTNECNIQPNTSNAWWGAELDILEARAKDDIMSTNIHAGGYKGSAGCYFSGHKDLQMRGMHEGFHTYGLRWKKDLLEWYYDGELVRTVDDPDYVSRGAGFFILSQGLFGGGWFVEGAIEKYEAEFGLPVTHKVDYVRFWKEVDECDNSCDANPCDAGFECVPTGCGTHDCNPEPTICRSSEPYEYEYHYSKRLSFNDAVEYCSNYDDGSWAIPNPANDDENQAIVNNAVEKYVKQAQDIWINVLHRDGEWGLNNGYSNWANEDKAKDPEQYGDGALIKTGTQSQPNGQWKQQFYQKTNGANKGRTLCVRKVEDPCDPKPTPSDVTCEPGVTCQPIEDPDPLKLPAGGCTNPNSDLDICATQCDGVNYGRSMVTRQMFSKNFWVYKAVGANAQQYAKLNNRYMFRLDHSQCSDKILTAIVENEIQFDVMDATEGLMTFESSYANFKEGMGDFNPDCNQNRRGLYLQFFRNRDVVENGEDFMSNNGNKDWFYWIVNNIASLPDLGINENDLNKCIKGAKVGLVKSPENKTDYTKCWAYDTCRIDPDW